MNVQTAAHALFALSRDADSWRQNQREREDETQDEKKKKKNKLFRGGWWSLMKENTKDRIDVARFPRYVMLLHVYRYRY